FEPVGIHQIETDAASTAGKQRIYDLNGNLQQGPLSKLPDGLYIINGKKIIKK
ncbi:MAG: peptidase, partial [Alloprevotella tannerae]|nr:peptidase [Alloprevotella tannerae]